MLGFLANLRDMKSSLTSGMLVLFALWLGYGNFIAEVEPDDSVAGNIRRLVEWLGPLPTLGLISFLAYFIGLVISSASLSKYIASIAYRTKHNENRHRAMLSRATQDNLDNYLEGVLDQAESREALPNIAQLLTYRPTSVEDAVRFKTYLDQGDDSEIELPPSEDAKWRGRIHSAITRAVLDRIEILAVQLGAKRETAYNRFDKATSEAEFRYSLFAPTLMVAAMAANRLVEEGSVEAGVVILVGALIASVVLLYKATHKLQEANAEVIHGIIIGEIDVTEIEALKKIAARPTTVEQ